MLLAHGPNQAEATIYYVDATTGNDGADGFDPGTAWQTLYKVSGYAFSGGDQVLLKRGEVWRERLEITGSGIEEAPITYGAYGTGPAPQINGSRLVSGWSLQSGQVWQADLASEPDAVYLDGVRGVTRTSIAALQAEQQWSWESGVLYQYCSQDPDSRYTAPGVEVPSAEGNILLTANYIIVQDLELIFSKAQGIYNQGQYNVIQNNLIRWAKTDSIDSEGSHALIRNNQVSNGGYGIWLHDTVGNTVAGNHVQACSSGVELNNTDHTLVVGNTLTGNVGPFSPGVFLYDSSYNQIIWNTISDNQDGIVQRSGPTAIGCTSNLFYQNRIFANRQHGFNAYNFNGHGSIIAYNLIFQNAESGLLFEGENTNNRLENNTIYANGNVGINLSSYATDWVIQNNIVAMNQDYEIYNVSTGIVTTSHNAYYRNTGNVVQADGVFYTLATLSAFEPSAIRSNPQMVSPATQDFHLKWDSPCRDAGLTLGYSRDADGQPVPMGTGIDIGALEYANAPHMETLQWSEISTGNFFAGTANNLVGQINCSGYQSDQLHSIQVENLGTAVNQTDIEAVWLWYQSGGGPFNAFVAQQLGQMTPVSSRLWRLDLDQEILDGSALYLTVDIRPLATQGSSCRFSVPTKGCAFLWAQSLPNSAIANVGSQLIQYRKDLQLQIGNVVTSHVLQGQRDIALLQLTLENVSGRSLEISTLGFEIQNSESHAIQLSAALENVRVEVNGVARGGANAYSVLDPYLIFSPVLTLPNQTSVVMTLRGDGVSVPNLSAFRAAIPNELCINAGTLAVSPAEGEIFPLRGGQINLREPRLEAVFSCYPNPFSAARQPAAIPYYLEKTSQVRIWVQTLTGELVRELVSRQQDPGLQKTQWDGKNSGGQSVKSGVYLLSIRVDDADGQRQTLRRKIAVAH